MTFVYKMLIFSELASIFIFCQLQMKLISLKNKILKSDREIEGK